MVAVGWDKARWPFQHAPEDAARYRREGLWRDRTAAMGLADLLDRCPDFVCLVDDAGRYSVAGMDRAARRLAAWMKGRGLVRGDVVAFQLPNRYEAAVIALAASMLGLVCLPIVPIYREAEVQFILTDSKARLMIVPETFRGFGHGAMARRIAADLPGLEVLSLGEDSANDPFAPAGWQGQWDGPAEGAPDDPWMLMYTSGTTGRPKGVVHSSNTLDCELCNVVAQWGLTGDRDVTLMPSPVTHVTGFLYGLLLPFFHGIRAVLMERWEARQAVEIIRREKATFTVGATPFLRELVTVVQDDGGAVPSLRVFACGGAPVPPDLIRRAHAVMPALLPCRVYGSTEAPTVTLGVETVTALDRAAETDGHIVGHEVRIAGDDGGSLGTGEDGEIRTRGPEVMLGYLNPTDHAAAFDSQGYFRSGDLGHVTADGDLVVTGRLKDLIIRGGENLSAKEIEDALHCHPDVEEVAVVAMPHPRLGETCCAFLRSRNQDLDVGSLSAFLTGQGLARQKHPEKVVVVEELPKTASGKIQKYVLRGMAAKATEA